MKSDSLYIKRVIELAKHNVINGGRPFSCLIVNSQDGSILCEATNQVAQSGDPTAHAEMLAIHEASKKLGQSITELDGKNGRRGEDMKGYTFYILNMPCTMCMTAMENLRG